MLAVIKTGGKQYVVSPGTKINIEKVDKKEGEEIVFSEILLLEKNKKVEIGAPFLKDAQVIGKVLKQGKGKKLIIFKYKPKKRFQRKMGHRQLFTEVEITKIEIPMAKPSRTLDADKVEHSRQSRNKIGAK